MSSSDPGVRRLHDLDMAECYARLRSRDVGRLAITDGDGILIVPVNYVVDGDDIAIRTSPYGLIGLSTPQQAAFEIDEADHEHRHGWSVLVRGTLAIDDPADAFHVLNETRLEPWPSGTRTMTLRLTPRTVTGRAL